MLLNSQFLRWFIAGHLPPRPAFSHPETRSTPAPTTAPVTPHNPRPAFKAHNRPGGRRVSEKKRRRRRLFIIIITVTIMTGNTTDLIAYPQGRDCSWGLYKSGRRPSKAFTPSRDGRRREEVGDVDRPGQRSHGLT